MNTSDEPKFFVKSTHASSLLVRILTRFGLKRSFSPNCSNLKFLWTDYMSSQGEKSYADDNVMMNHLPYVYCLRNKYLMYFLLKSLYSEEEIDFLPETYALDDPNEKKIFLNRFRNDEMWISKPMQLMKGLGMKLVRKINDIPPESKCKDRLIQKYISDPLLINNKKFDIRCYMLIASTQPFLVLFSHGYVRICLKNYDKNSNDLVGHLTNQSFQRHHPSFAYSGEKTIMTMEVFNNYLNQKFASHHVIQPNWVFKTLKATLKNISFKCFNIVKENLVSNLGNFQLLGLDFLIDRNFKVWLLEINTNPALRTDTSVVKMFFEQFMKETIKIVIECHKKNLEKKPLLPLNSLEKYEVLYSDSLRYQIRSRKFTHSKHKVSLRSHSPLGREKSLDFQMVKENIARKRVMSQGFK